MMVNVVEKAVELGSIVGAAVSNTRMLTSGTVCAMIEVRKVAN